MPSTIVHPLVRKEWSSGCRHIKGKDVLLITNAKVSPLYTDQVVASILEIGGDINVEGIVLQEGERSKLKVMLISWICVH